VVVAVVVVRVVQPPVDEEVGVVAVRDGLVPAARAVLVLGVVAVGGLGVPVRVGRAHVDRVLVDVVFVRVVQVAVVQVVDVAFVADRGVAAALPVDVLVALVNGVLVMGHAATVRNARRSASNRG
jgi:hypothetical protein